MSANRADETASESSSSLEETFLVDVEEQPPKRTAQRVGERKLALLAVTAAFGSFLISLLVGGYFVFSSLGDVRAASGTTRWQSTDAELLEFDREAVERGDLDGPVVKYRYGFGVEGFVSDRLAIDPDGEETRFMLDHLLDGTYAVGRTVTAYVNPDAPEQSVLARSSGWEVGGRRLWTGATLLALAGLSLAILIVGQNRIDDIDSSDERYEAFRKRQSEEFRTRGRTERETEHTIEEEEESVIGRPPRHMRPGYRPSKEASQD